MVNLHISPSDFQGPVSMGIPDRTEIHVAIAGLAIGGAERIVLDWAVRVFPRWKVHLIVLRSHAEEWPAPSFVRVTRLDQPDRMNGLSVSNASKLDRLRFVGMEIASSGNPVCMCHLLTSEERGAIADGGAEVVTVLHNAKTGWIEPAEHLRDSYRVVSVSDACAVDLRESGWDRPITVIRHLPSSRKPVPGIREELLKRWNIPLTATVIGMIGAVKPQKNYPFAIHVLKALLQKRDAYLVILGGPISRNGRNAWESVMNAIKDDGVRKRVAMPGFVPDAESCLPAFDIVLNTSHYEGLSIATLEALASGIPVVASAVGGQGEVTGEGLCLVPTGTPEERWADIVNERIGSKPAIPSWAKFPAYRLWTLTGIARRIPDDSEKTLFITANLNSGGAQRSLVNLAKEIGHRLDFEIAVTESTTTPYFYEELLQAGIGVVRTGQTGDPFEHAENIVWKACSEGVRTLCLWNVGAKLKLLLVKALEPTGIRIVDVSPGDYVFEEMQAVSDFQRLIAFSETEYRSRLDTFVQKFNGPVPEEYREKTVVIQNGIPESPYGKTDYSISGKPRIVVSGRIAPSKFTLEILEAMRLVRERIPDAEIHFFGGVEPYHREYGDKVSEAVHDGSGKNVFFHGVDFEVRDHLAEYDVYLVLGKNQGCPNALMEALSVGMPAVANDDGGTGEQVIDCVTGRLVADVSPDKVADALVQLLSDRELAKRLGTAAREHIRKGFSMENMTDGYLSVLSGVVIEKELCSVD